MYAAKVSGMVDDDDGWSLVVEVVVVVVVVVFLLSSLSCSWSFAVVLLDCIHPFSLNWIIFVIADVAGLAPESGKSV